MYRSKPDIYEMLDTLSLEMKEELLEYLKADIAAAKAAPKGSYLEEQWTEIERLIENLRYEPYIDDQVEIDEIWDICDKMIKSGELKNESWKTRERVIKSIIEDEYYDYYGVSDPMKDLFKALMITQEEKLKIADLIYKTGSDYMKKDGAELYKECGQQEKYYTYVEEHLEKKEKPYMELINYYKTVNPAKAVEIAELGMKKCKDDQTDIFIFLIECARKEEDKNKEAKLLTSAKLRSAVNFSKVKAALEKAGQ
ncbi:MAG: hypothetical protein IJ719_17355 [Clostridia bacterium]|nr:hypothetical protein [Clostridia bacterium]